MNQEEPILPTPAFERKLKALPALLAEESAGMKALAETRFSIGEILTYLKSKTDPNEWEQLCQSMGLSSRQANRYARVHLGGGAIRRLKNYEAMSLNEWVKQLHTNPP